MERPRPARYNVKRAQERLHRRSGKSTPHIRARGGKALRRGKAPRPGASQRSLEALQPGIREAVKLQLIKKWPRAITTRRLEIITCMNK